MSPPDAILARLGALPGDLPAEVVSLWPENAKVVEVFTALQTQWAVGGAGQVIGLRYEALPTVLDLLGVKKARRRELFDGLRLMEAEVLQAVHESGMSDG